MLNRISSMLSIAYARHQQQNHRDGSGYYSTYTQAAGGTMSGLGQ